VVIGNFVLISGLPGSGKSTIARQLAPLLRLQVVDKDDILERLYETRGVGDAVWRRALSREADRILQHDATASDGAVLVSLWHMAGMPHDSGTPCEWLSALSTHIVHVHCVCDPHAAARRFIQRTRHHGHLDDAKRPDEIVERIRALSSLPPPVIGTRIDVDTTRTPDAAALAHSVRRVLQNL
jgi:tRNA uridine 5-carbamoylmethylation protein Kti12